MHSPGAKDEPRGQGITQRGTLTPSFGPTIKALESICASLSC